MTYTTVLREYCVHSDLAQRFRFRERLCHMEQWFTYSQLLQCRCRRMKEIPNWLHFLTMQGYLELGECKAHTPNSYRTKEEEIVRASNNGHQWSQVYSSYKGVVTTLHCQCILVIIRIEGTCHLACSIVTMEREVAHSDSLELIQIYDHQERKRSYRRTEQFEHCRSTNHPDVVL